MKKLLLAACLLTVSTTAVAAPWNLTALCGKSWLHFYPKPTCP